MSDKKIKMWPVAINVLAGLVIAAVIAMQFVNRDAIPTGGPEGENMAARNLSGEPNSGEQNGVEPATGVAAVDGARIVAADAEPGNWMTHGRTYSEQRFSPLTQIDDTNVTKLGLAWSFATDTSRGLEATPIVVDGRMFTTGNWGVVFALDAKTGEELWTFDPEVPGEWGRYACCDVVNRGVAVWKGKVYVASLDGRLFALDAQDGSVVWEVDTIDRTPSYTITGAPRVVNGKVIIGNGGGEYGVRGFITAYDAETGAQVWRFYTVPGDPSKGFEHPEMEAAAKTWKGGRWWEVGGGGTAWDSMAFDPDLNTLYVGVGNGSPWTREIRSPGGGDNLYLASVLALDPDTGRLKWHYQETPGDNWDYTSTQHMILADLEIDGKPRKVLLHAPKNGFFYVMDRETGELISVNNYVTVTWAKGIDLKTGRPIENPELKYAENTQFILPSAAGGHNWHPMAFNPNTGLVYIPTQEMAGIYALSDEWKEHKTFTVQKGWWNPGIEWRAWVDVLSAMPEIPINQGYLKAWDPVKNEERWAVEFSGVFNGGLLTTAGNLLFEGMADGRFLALSADKGQLLWEVPINTGIVAPPISYMVDGEQYIAVMAGWGGIGVPLGDPRVAAAGKYENDGKLLVFKLGGTATLPTATLRKTTIPQQPPVEASADELYEGSVLYMGHCGVCHGALAVSSGVLPDLRMMNEQTRENFEKIVIDGMLKDRGMASFGDLLSAEDVAKIKAYITKRATEDRARQIPTD